MIEIRNDELTQEAGQKKWAELLSALLSQIRIEGEAAAYRPRAERDLG